MDKNARIYVAGHRGLVGSAIVRKLQKDNYVNLIIRTHSELDLTDSTRVKQFFQEEKPEYVFLAAAKVGGIHANNTYPAEFIYQNLQIQNNVIHQAYLNGVKKLLFLGSVCIYPKFAKQPVQEESLLTGSLEPTNEPYAIAKIAGIKMCQSYNRQYQTNYISVMPANLYGPYDNFDLHNSHVIPAMIRKFHEAKQNGHIPVNLWGTGTPRREFVYSDDMADGCIYIMNHLNAGDLLGDLCNIGTGVDITIKELALTIQSIIGHHGTIAWDTGKPDGTPGRLMDNNRLTNLGWMPKISFNEGLQRAYDWFCSEWGK
ncbi:MAG: GDP-L-fucose synthase [SAR324 cluster bacterium]|nr:GDP-L-fucose synthase [SAR324 cluster bacterium]